MLFLCFCVFFPSVLLYELTTQPNKDNHSDILDISANLTAIVRNDTTPKNNITFITERITQPSKKIERILETISTLPSMNDTRKTDSKSKSTSFDQFKPSPQLETYYEYNKFSVPPAQPEAKTFGDFGNSGYYLNSWNEKSTSNVPWSNNHNGIQNSWYEKSKNPSPWDQHFKTNPIATTEKPWTTRVKFPTTEAKENPYKFVSSDEKLNSYLPPTNFPSTTEGFSFNKPVEIPNKYNSKPSGPGFWQKLMGNIGNSVNKNGGAAQKTFFDYNLMEKPPHYGPPVKEYDTGMSSYSSGNPWTKIIKLLTAVIPIGLFISALTPTVISVTSVNDTTQSRYRADISNHQELTDRLASSLKYAEQIRSCEDKILCELLVTAIISKNSADHINNLLDTFTEHEDLASKKDDLLKVFEAAKKEDCSSIVCKTVNQN